MNSVFQDVAMVIGFLFLCWVIKGINYKNAKEDKIFNTDEDEQIC